jgi:hypothetical protein
MLVDGVETGILFGQQSSVRQHPHAEAAAEVAEFAGAQGKFWGDGR